MFLIFVDFYDPMTVTFELLSFTASELIADNVSSLHVEYVEMFMNVFFFSHNNSQKFYFL